MYALPKRFDINEGIVIGFSVILLLLFIFLPKRFPLSTTLILLTLGSFSARLGDILFFPYDLYDVMDRKKHNLFDFCLYTAVYSFYVYFYCYFYDKVKLGNGRQFFHIFMWVLISLAFEWLGQKIGIYTYKGWKLYYSAIIYLLMFSLYTLVFTYIRNFHQNGT